MKNCNHHIRALAVSAAIVVLTAPAASAQQAERRALLESEVLVHPVELAAHPEVQRDLGLTSRQMEDIQQIAAGLQDKIGEVLRERKLPRVLRLSAINTAREDAEQKLDALLDRAQWARLEQIRLQQDGYVSLVRPELARKIDLDSVQGAMLRQGSREMYKYQQRLVVDIRYEKLDIDFDEIPGAMAKVKQQFNNQFGMILTEKQKARWDKLVGKPLPIALSPLRYNAEPLAKVKKRFEVEAAVLLDVRDQDQWDAGHIDGAVLLPLSEMVDKDKQRAFVRKLVQNVPREKIVYCYCDSGRRSLVATSIIRELSVTYDVRALKEGYDALVEAGFPAAGSTTGQAE